MDEERGTFERILPERKHSREEINLPSGGLVTTDNFVVDIPGTSG